MTLGLAIPLANIFGVFGISYGMYTPDITGSFGNISVNIGGIIESAIWEYNEIYKITVLVVIIIGFGVYEYIKNKDKKILMPPLIFFLLSILGYIYLSCARTSMETKYMLPSLILLIPYSVNGLYRWINTNMNHNLWRYVLVIIIVGLSTYSLGNFVKDINKNYNYPMALKPQEAQFHEWVRDQHISQDEVVVSNAPHVLYLGTGLHVIYIYSQDINYDVMREIDKKYNVRYVAIYEYDKHPAADIEKLEKLENELNAEKLFDSEGIHFYEVR
jgi:hypothetical protein